MLITPTPLDHTIAWQKPFRPHRMAISTRLLWKEISTFSTAEAATPKNISFL